MWFSKSLSRSCMVVLIACSTFVGSENHICDEEAVFEIINKGQPLDQDVTSNHYVNSWLECGSKCLENLECTTFSHSTEPHHNINCKISNTTGEFVIRHGDETWTTYEIRSIGLDICLTQHLCLNDGRCVRQSCEPEGYMCICSEGYHGKYCKHKTSDLDNFDVVFAAQDPELSYTELDNMITSDLTQFTFSTWFKISTGQNKYHLLSHKTDGFITGNLGFSFVAPDLAPIQRFDVDILQNTISVFMTPINDNIWHHLGTVWDNSNGRLDVLIDGTPLYLNSKIQKDGIIPGGGKFVIGQQYTLSGFEADAGFIGQINGMNLWNTAFSGEVVEAMAELRENSKGNILSWAKVIGNIFGDIQVVRPSTVYDSNKGLNFELEFESKEDVNYVLYPGPNAPFNEISICLWMKSFKAGTFVSYDVLGESAPAFSFGIDKACHLFAHVNGSLYTSNVSDDSVLNNQWQYLCIVRRDNKIVFYRNSVQLDDVTQTLVTYLPQGGKFAIGVTKYNGPYYKSFVGTLTFLNIWSIFMTDHCVRNMANGGQNINGDFLAWRYVPGQIVGNLVMVPNAEIYVPGYSLIDRRSKWCNENVRPKCGSLYARIGGDINGERMAWRCYCTDALFESKVTYQVSKQSTAYETKHEDLIAVV